MSGCVPSLSNSVFTEYDTEYWAINFIMKHLSLMNIEENPFETEESGCSKEL